MQVRRLQKRAERIAAREIVALLVAKCRICPAVRGQPILRARVINLIRTYCRNAARPVYPGAAVLAAIIVAGIVAGCSDDSSKAKPAEAGEAVTVVVVPARSDAVQRSVDVVGTLYGQEDVTISNKVPGKVIAIYKDVGDRVAPGEPLDQLLQNDYQLSLNEK